jgi:[ribosomal protein S5]-alanine N-acetyltransferase
MLPETLHTPRLVLRRPRAQDAATIFQRYAQDPEVTRYLTFRPHRQLAETEDFIDRCLRAWDAGIRRPWVLTPAEDDRAIGMLDLRLGEHGVDVGYVLARSAWGQGLMPEALRAVVDLVLAEAALFRIAAVCDVDNKASARVMEKAEMQREGLLRRYMVHPNVSAEPRDVYLYAKTR